jgi:hypothetical protein
MEIQAFSKVHCINCMYYEGREFNDNHNRNCEHPKNMGNWLGPDRYDRLPKDLNRMCDCPWYAKDRRSK